MPRRMRDVTPATNASETSTVFRCHAGMAEVIAATPAAMLTETVST